MQLANTHLENTWAASDATTSSERKSRTAGLLGGLLGIGGLIGVVLGPVVTPPEGTPCLDRHVVMCAPEPPNHSPDRHETEPQWPSKEIRTQEVSPVAIGIQDLVRKPQ